MNTAADHVMAYRVLLYTQSLPGDRRPLSEQAAELLDLRLWGLTDANQMRNSFQPGDSVIAYVGGAKPELIGHGVLASGFHRWTPEEQRRYTDEFGEFSSGLALSEHRVWERPVPFEEIWPRLERSQGKKPLKYLRRAPRLSEKDFQTLLAAAGERRHSSKPDGREEGGLRRIQGLEPVRDPWLREEKFAAVREAVGLLACEACGFDPVALYGDPEYGRAALDCHHREPLAGGRARCTRLDDLAVLCANCHRVLHATEPLLSVEELRASVGTSFRPSSHAPAETAPDPLHRVTLLV